MWKLGVINMIDTMRYVVSLLISSKSNGKLCVCVYVCLDLKDRNKTITHGHNTIPIIVLITKLKLPTGPAAVPRKIPHMPSLFSGSHLVSINCYVYKLLWYTSLCTWIYGSVNNVYKLPIIGFTSVINQYP